MGAFGKARLLGLVLVLGLVGCTGGEDPRPSAEQTSQESVGSGHVPDEHPAQEAAGAALRCRGIQEPHIGHVLWLVHEVEVAWTWPTARGAEQAAARLQRRLGRLTPLVDAECDARPPQFTGLRRAVLTHAEEPRNRRTVTGLRAALRRWAGYLGADAKLRRHLSVVRGCRELSRTFVVSHRVWWRWAEHGKTFWIRLTFDNRTERSVVVSLSGTAVASELTRPEVSLYPARGILRWGGSSADFDRVPRGSSTHDVAPLAGPEVDTEASGSLRVVESEVGLDLGMKGDGDYCSMPTQPEP